MNYSLYGLVNSLFTIFEIIILIRVLSSWIPAGRDNQFMALIYRISEPILAPIRQMLAKTPLGGTMIDFSPIAAFLLLSIVRKFIVGLLF